MSDNNDDVCVICGNPNLPEGSNICYECQCKYGLYEDEEEDNRAIRLKNQQKKLFKRRES